MERARESATLGVLALVAGLLGFGVAMGPRLFAVFAFAAGLAGAVLGIVAMAKNQGRGMGVAGLILGVLAVAVALASMVQMDASLNELQRDLEQIGD